MSYGYGLCIEARFDEVAFGHSGGTFGFTSYFTYYPGAQLLTVVLANIENGSAQGLERDLGALVLGQPYVLPSSRPFIELPTEVLRRYVGRYRCDFAGRVMEADVALVGDKLQIKFPLLRAAALAPMSESRFFTRLKGGEVTLDFDLPAAAGASSGRVVLDWGGQRFECPRLAVGSSMDADLRG
jgi:hypothetical protein